jgi:antirestriction protein ArdC
MTVYEIVTAKIIEQLEGGVAPWQKPWRSEPPCNFVTRKPYRGINPFLLAPQGYASPFWLTFNQAKQLGGHVKQGAKSSLITFWKIGEERNVRQPDGTDRKSKPILLRYFNVFNLDQTEGITYPATAHVPSIEQCEKIVSEMPNAPKLEQTDRAYYRPSNDTVGIPPRDSFSSPESYYSTLFHELAHSTGHPKRIGRDGIEKLNSFGSEQYSKEELVAELSAAMLSGICGITPATLDNSASYLRSWINVLRGDSKLVVSAASAAQRAADYIRGVSKPDAEEAVAS